MSDGAPAPDDEVARIRRTYEGYARDGANAARWDAEQPGNRLILAERDRLLRDTVPGLLADRPSPTSGRPLRVLDLGSGEGDVLAALATEVTRTALRATLVGVDLLESRLAKARVRHPDLPAVAADGAHLPLPDRSIDLLSVFTVFSSILDPGLARGVAAEIGRVVRPDGAVVWYDLRRDNPRNRSVRGLTDRAVAALFPAWTVSLRSCTVLPPLARRVAPVLPGAYPLLARVPPLRTHLFGLLRPPQ